MILTVFAAVFVCGAAYESNFSTIPAYASSKVANLQIKSLRYEPYPGNPGEYVKLWVKVENLGTGHTADAMFKLIPKFPFSLDSPDDAVKRYGSLGYGRQQGDNVVVLEYKLKVDKNAVEGTNSIELKYNTDGGESWFSKIFSIEIANAQTDFDLVIQEIEDKTAAIAIANTGKNIAYSVIVKIPEQENFDTVGTSGQMVGNLENGDYSMVSFELKEKTRTAAKKILLVQIDYTDNIGERRTVIKEVVYEAGASTMPAGSAESATQKQQTNGNQRRFVVQQQNEIYQEWWFWAIIIAAVFIAWRGFKFIKEKKRKK